MRLIKVIGKKKKTNIKEKTRPPIAPDAKLESTEFSADKIATGNKPATTEIKLMARNFIRLEYALI